MIHEHRIDPYGILGLPTNSDGDRCGDLILSPLFESGSIHLYYTIFDRMIAGGVSVTIQDLELVPTSELKSDFFLQNREMIIYCLGSSGRVSVGLDVYDLEIGDALYLGKQPNNPIFHGHKSNDGRTHNFYFVSAPAHRSTPDKWIKKKDVIPLEKGSSDNLNRRDIFKMVTAADTDLCQLQSGITELYEYQLYNTVPPHVHSRRSEIYFYFDVPEHGYVKHFVGNPHNIESVNLKNNTAIFVPPGHVHYGKGSSNYSFIWAMAGENLDYDDMDPIENYPL